MGEGKQMGTVTDPLSGNRPTPEKDYCWVGFAVFMEDSAGDCPVTSNK